jgi:hypothetical protein
MRIVSLLLIIVFYSFGELIITEISPSPETGQSEWFEIKNSSPNSLLLSDFTFITKEDLYSFTDNDIVINTQSYAIITQDSSNFLEQYPASILVIEPPTWSTLYNSEGFITVRNRDNEISDSVFYSSENISNWSSETIIRHSENKSATDSSSWIKASQPTPGFPNPQASTSNSTSKLSASPFPFSPDGDGVDDELTIKVELSESQDATVTIVGMSGEVFWEQEGVESGNIIWDGIKQNGNPAPIGPSFIFLKSSGGDEKRCKVLLWRD